MQNDNNTSNKKYSVKVIIKWLLNVLRDNWLQTSVNALTGILSVVVSLSAVWAVKHAIDVASGYHKGSVYLSVALIATLILCEFAISITKIWVRNTLGIKARNKMQIGRAHV